MDTTNAPPPPGPPPADAGAWWRQPLADLLDVLLVALVGLLVGGVLAGLFLAGSSGGGWEELGAAILGLGAGLVAAFVTWVVLLARAARGRTTPGSLVVEPDSGALAAAARHVAVVLVLWAGSGVAAAALEPWPAGPLGGGLLAAVGTGAALTAWGRGPRAARLRVVGVAAVVGLLLTGTIPDRAPYAWELQTTANDALVAMMEDDSAARRACTEGAAVGLVLASHQTGPCADPDRVWMVDRAPAATAEQLAAAARRAVGDEATVRWDRRFEELVVTVDEDVVAIVTARADCTSRVALGRYDPGGPGAEATCS